MRARRDWVPLAHVVIFAPLAGAASCAFVPRARAPLIRWWALVVTLVTFGLSLGMLAAFHGGDAGYQLVDRATWVPSLHLSTWSASTASACSWSC